MASGTARLEWACEEAVVAARLPPLAPAELGQVAPETLAEVGLVLQPCFAHRQLPVPRWSAWRAVQVDGAGEPVDLALGPQHGVVTCGETGPVLTRCPKTGSCSCQPLPVVLRSEAPSSRRHSISRRYPGCWRGSSVKGSSPRCGSQRVKVLSGGEIEMSIATTVETADGIGRSGRRAWLSWCQCSSPSADGRHLAVPEVRLAQGLRTGTARCTSSRGGTHVPLLAAGAGRCDAGTTGELLFPVLLIIGLLSRSLSALGLSAVDVLAIVWSTPPCC